MGSVKLRQFKLRIKKKTKILICTVCKELKVYDKIEGKEKEGMREREARERESERERGEGGGWNVKNVECVKGILYVSSGEKMRETVILLIIAL